MRAAGIVILLTTLSVMGCGGSRLPPQPPTELPQLTIEEWKTLPIEEKYDAATFERLREADESLSSDRAWNKFMMEVIIPERKIDIPGVPGQP